jgi:hypothetical protein
VQKNMDRATDYYLVQYRPEEHREIIEGNVDRFDTEGLRLRYDYGVFNLEEQMKEESFLMFKRSSDELLGWGELIDDEIACFLFSDARNCGYGRELLWSLLLIARTRQRLSSIYGGFVYAIIQPNNKISLKAISGACKMSGDLIEEYSYLNSLYKFVVKFKR